MCVCELQRPAVYCAPQLASQGGREVVRCTRVYEHSVPHAWQAEGRYKARKNTNKEITLSACGFVYSYILVPFFTVCPFKENKSVWLNKRKGTE